MKKIIAWIFARGGSKGLPRKNILPLLDKPLISYSIEIGHQSKYISDVYVSTDDEEIALTAKEYGAKVPFLRPAELASDCCPEHLSWQHAVKYMISSGINCDVFVSLPATSPLRTVTEVDQCIEQYLHDDADVTIAISQTNRHPSFSMVFRDERGIIRLALPPEKQIRRRQDAPPVYNISGVAYVTSPSYILKTDSYMRGRVSSIIIPEEDAIDIDSLIDFEIASIILKKRNIK